MKIKRLVITLILIPTSIYCSITCFAHSGRTDAYGGHYGDGGYHYHHGYPAHQHPNGTCPYNFDDQTDHSNNGGNSSSADYIGTWNSETKKNSHTTDIIAAIAIIILIILGIITKGKIFHVLFGIFVVIVFFPVFLFSGICSIFSKIKQWLK